MKVRVICDTYKGRPKEKLLPGDSEFSNPILKVGAESDVYAVVVFQGRIKYCVADESGDFLWEYPWMFEVLDGGVPSDWIVNCFDEDVSMILGPEFVAKNLESYQAFVELLPEMVRQMKMRSSGHPTTPQ